MIYHRNSNITHPESPIQTIYSPGMTCSQTQLLKYTGNQITASTGELMQCSGKNGFRPLNIIHNPYIVTDIPDVNLYPFDSFFSYFNPIKWGLALKSYFSNWMYGFEFQQGSNEGPETVVWHTLNISKLNIGQNTDIEKHNDMYEQWTHDENKKEGLVLFGVSRGTCTTTSAYSRYQYADVKLVILEGAVDSIDNVLLQRMENIFGPGRLADFALKTLNFMLTLFTEYDPDGISPLKMVDQYPKNTPTVFITSDADTEVPSINTERICHRLAAKNQNPVYLLRLKKSSHPNYMFDDADDRQTYQEFMNAVYGKHVLQIDNIEDENILKQYLVNPENITIYTAQNAHEDIRNYLNNLNNDSDCMDFFKSMVSIPAATKRVVANKLKRAVNGEKITLFAHEYDALHDGKLGDLFKKIKKELPKVRDNISQYVVDPVKVAQHVMQYRYMCH